MASSATTGVTSCIKTALIVWYTSLSYSEVGCSLRPCVSHSGAKLEGEKHFSLHALSSVGAWFPLSTFWHTDKSPVRYCRNRLPSGLETIWAQHDFVGVRAGWNLPSAELGRLGPEHRGMADVWLLALPACGTGLLPGYPLCCLFQPPLCEGPLYLSHRQEVACWRVRHPAVQGASDKELIGA